jgi:hypothetical protein
MTTRPGRTLAQPRRQARFEFSMHSTILATFASNVIPAPASTTPAAHRGESRGFEPNPWETLS